MDPVASGLTILDTVRKAVKAARKLYGAPRELQELQVEVDTFTAVLNDLIVGAFDVRWASDGIRLAISATQACLLELQQLIQYELLKEVPEGTKARRTAWLRKVSRVHEFQEKLSDCRANVILAIDSNAAVVVRRSEATLQEIRILMHQKAEDISKNLEEYTTDSRRAHDFIRNKLEEIHEQKWDTHWAMLEAQKLHYEQLESRIHGLLAGTHRLAVEGPAQNLANSNDDRRHLISAGCPHAIQSLTPPPPKLSYEAAPGKRRQFSKMEDFPAADVSALLVDCAWYHTEFCSPVRRSETRLPTRVLDVTMHGSDVRLYESVAVDRANYVALSYCWGQVAPMVTTHSSLQSRKNSIPWNIIPSLFQDAIIVTRMLGFRYLWLDALCILQDDAVDWDHESADMANIFGNAALTIVARSSPNVSSGLSLPPPSAESSTTTQLVSTGTSPCEDLARPIEAYVTLMTDMAKSQSSDRAWIHQEALLSARCLHFVDGTVIFECGHGFAPLLEQPVARQLAFLPHPDETLRRRCAAATPKNFDCRDMLDTWWQVVEDYSSRKLTYHSDKMVAISGLACRFAQRLGAYTAGLWLEHNFICSLGWRPIATSRRPEIHTAPSWSWASLEGAVAGAYTSSATPAARLLHHELKPIGQNRLGALEVATITLKGRYVEIHVEGYETDDDQCLIYANYDRFAVVIEADAFQVFARGITLACLEISRDAEGNINCLVLAPTPDDKWKRIAIMQMYRRRGEHRWFEDHRLFEFAII